MLGRKLEYNDLKTIDDDLEKQTIERIQSTLIDYRDIEETILGLYNRVLLDAIQDNR